MLAKVELRDAGVEKDANYAVDPPLRQSFGRAAANAAEAG
jgi:hypothetical protein